MLMVHRQQNDDFTLGSVEEEDGGAEEEWRKRWAEVKISTDRQKALGEESGDR